MLADPVTVPIPAGTVIPIAQAGDGDPFIVYNGDITNVLYVSHDTNPVLMNSVPVQPLTAAVLTDAKKWYGSGNGVPIASVTVAPGGTQMNPSPDQVATQIATLGLATASNQTAQITQETAVAGNTNTTATNTGTTATNVAAVNNNIALGTNPAVQSLSSNQQSIVSATGNPFFTSPTGTADTSGWNAFNGTATLQAAGLLGAVSLPAGSGYPNGGFLTPNGSSTTIGLQPNHIISCKPGQIPFAHFRLNVNGNTGSTPSLQAQIIFSYFTSTSTFISSTTLTAPLSNFSNVWTQINGEDDLGAPAGTAYVNIDYIYTGGASNILASQTAYVTACIGGILGASGTTGGNHSRHHAVAGTPLLHGYNVLQAPGSFTNVAASSLKTFTYNISKPGYIIGFNAGIAAAATVPVYSVRMFWVDAASGTAVAEEVWWLPANTTTNIKVYGKGPTKGNQLTIQIGNSDPAQTLNVFWQLSETTQHVARDDWRSDAISAVPSNVAPNFVSPANSDPFALLTANHVIVNMAASVNQWVLLPLYSGQANVYWNSSVAQAAQLQIATWDPSINTVPFANPLVLNVPIPAAKQAGPFITYLPRMPCVLNIVNGAAIATVAVTVNGIEYAS